MSTKVVVFDVDGVLADFINYAVDLGYQLANRPCPTKWVQQGWDDYGGLSEYEVKRLWAHIEIHPDFWFHLPCLLTDAEKDLVDELYYRGHRVYFATNRRLPGALEYTTRWLTYNLSIANPHVVITKRKGEFCRVVDADYYIDDKSENVDCAIWLTDGRTKAYVKDAVTNRGQYAPHSSKARRAMTVQNYLEDVLHGK